jgi:hypothetical protein
VLHRQAIAAALAAAVLAPSIATADDVFLVSPEVMEFFNGEYKNLKPPRAMAVSADGYHVGYSACPSHRCRMLPSARDLAMQACLSAGGQRCRLFAVDDDIQVDYRVMDVATLAEPAPVLPKEQPSLVTQPCANKTQAQCDRIAADFAARRKQIEENWAKKIEEQQRFYCSSGTGGHPCMIVKQSEATRDAELGALDAELRQQLAAQ